MTKQEKYQILDNIIIKYKAALKMLGAQIDIIKEDCISKGESISIEHVRTRIKEYDSIIQKLENDGIPFTQENVEKYIKDIAGIRIVCASNEDIYKLIDIIRRSSNILVDYEKDFINNPKPSGYRSYHLIVQVPVELVEGNCIVNAEIQIRTLAMDLWATLNHKLVYKTAYTSDYIDQRLRMIAESLNQIDLEMASLLDLQDSMKKSDTSVDDNTGMYCKK